MAKVKKSCDDKGRKKIDLRKFPRTRHLLDLGGNGVTRDDLLMSKSEAECFLKGKNISVEEKLDGANIGFSISEDSRILVQNRSHYVTSSSHRQFSTLDNWVLEHEGALFSIVGSGKFILYGEWLYAKHSIFYTNLPSQFMAFDIFNVQEGEFVSRRERNLLLEGTGIETVPLITERTFKQANEVS